MEIAISKRYLVVGWINGVQTGKPYVYKRLAGARRYAHTLISVYGCEKCVIKSLDDSFSETVTPENTVAKIKAGNSVES